MYKLYQRIMDHWRRLFPEQILSVSYETLVTHPEPVLSRILAFCGLDWEPACLEFQKSAKVVNTASAEQVRRSLYKSSIYNWEGVASHLEPAIKILGELARYQPIPAD